MTVDQPPAPPPLPTQPPAQPPPPGSQPLPDQARGFFASLFDTRFDNLITPGLIRFIYILVMILMTIGYVVAVVAGFNSSGGSGVATLLLAPIFFLLYLILIRVWLELVVVAFKIREATEETARNTRR
jgi:glycerol-3-phosphate acyltransferase PlsY